MWNQGSIDLIDSTADAAFVADGSGTIRAWNRGMEELSGFKGLSVVGHPCFEVMQGRSAFGSNVCGFPCTVMRCVSDRKSVSSFDMSVRTNSQRRVWVTVSILALRDLRASNESILHILVDRTYERRRLELTTGIVRLAREMVELPSLAPASPPVLELTAREKETLRLLAQGSTPTQIASQLKIGPQTLRNRLSQINSKMGTSTRLEALVQARLRGII